ncbi:MAG: helix-turn-helix transcriptional regulator [Micromonosporaceae bacterium]
MAVRRQRLAQRRRTVGLSQEGLAERLRVERSTVARWESGETEPQPWLRPRLARVLQISVDQLGELLMEAPAQQVGSKEDSQRRRPVGRIGTDGEASEPQSLLESFVAPRIALRRHRAGDTGVGVSGFDGMS